MDMSNSSTNASPSRGEDQDDTPKHQKTPLSAVSINTICQIAELSHAESDNSSTRDLAPGKSKDRARKRKKRAKPGNLANNILNSSRERLVQPRGVEEELLRSVDLGDIPTVRRILQANPHTNVNCTDILGRTPLRLAVENEQPEIVELLLDKTDPRYLYESMLLAITLDHDEIALTILRHPIYEKMEARGEIDQFQNSDESLFAAETTPLILAAQRNRYEVVSVLLQRGQTIAHPHSQSCDCATCLARTSVDELRFARSRLNAYRGLASEAYISLSSGDPILTAFERSRTLKSTATKEKHYRDEYEELSNKLSDFVVKLMNNVRGNEELDVILNEEGDLKCDAFHGTHGTLARLKLALKYNEKGFVAHPSVQKKLSTIWYGDFQPYALMLPHRIRWLADLLLAFAIPFIALGYWFTHLISIRKFLHIPYVKFMGQTASFLVFLSIIVIYSLVTRPNLENVETVADIVGSSNSNLSAFEKDMLTSDRYFGLDISNVKIREKNPTALTIIMFVFVTGLVGQECLQLYVSGVMEHFDLFNIIDFISLNLYYISFALISITFYKVQQGVVFFQQEGSFARLLDGDLVAREYFYWVVADRAFWRATDPTNICEGVFAVANVLSFTRLLYILAANEQLGPLQVSIRRMMSDVSRFFVIFAIVFVAFMVGLNNMYWYYDPATREIVQAPISADLQANAGEAFGTFERTLTTVFWACFGMGDSDVVELNDYDAGFTTRVGYIVFGAYNTAVVIVLFNMLIAMMTRSFDTIQNDESQEWKFARAQLYMDILQDSSFLPVPLNIIPSPMSLYKGCKRLVQLFAACYRKCRRCRAWCARRPIERLHRHRPEGDSINNQDQKGITNPAFRTDICEDGEDMVDGVAWVGKSIRQASIESSQQNFASDGLLSYEVVMKRVVKRYIFESQKVESSPLEGDIEELKQDLSSFKYEVINAITTQKGLLSDSLNMVSAKLDMYSVLHGASIEQIQETNTRLNQMRKLTERDAANAIYSRQSKTKFDTPGPSRGMGSRKRKSVKEASLKRRHSKSRSSASRDEAAVQVVVMPTLNRDADDESGTSSVDEELIVADIVIYGDTPGKMQTFIERSAPQRSSSRRGPRQPGGSIVCSDASPDSCGEDAYLASSSNYESDSATTSKLTNDMAYTCAACSHRQTACFRPAYRPTYTRHELHRLIAMMNGEPVQDVVPPVEIRVESAPSLPPSPASIRRSARDNRMLQVRYPYRTGSDTESPSGSESEWDDISINQCEL